MSTYYKNSLLQHIYWLIFFFHKHFSPRSRKNIWIAYIDFHTWCWILPQYCSGKVTGTKNEHLHIPESKYTFNQSYRVFYGSKVTTGEIYYRYCFLYLLLNEEFIDSIFCIQHSVFPQGYIATGLGGNNHAPEHKYTFRWYYRVNNGSKPTKIPIWDR